MMCALARWARRLAVPRVSGGVPPCDPVRLAGMAAGAALG